MLAARVFCRWAVNRQSNYSVFATVKKQIDYIDFGESIRLISVKSRAHQLIIVVLHFLCGSSAHVGIGISSCKHE